MSPAKARRVRRRPRWTLFASPGCSLVVGVPLSVRPRACASSADIFGAPQKWAAAEHVLMIDHAGGDETRWEVFVEGKDANAQVFQVRDGVLSERQGFYLAGDG